MIALTSLLLAVACVAAMVSNAYTLRKVRSHRLGKRLRNRPFQVRGTIAPPPSPVPMPSPVPLPPPTTTTQPVALVSVGEPA